MRGLTCRCEASGSAPAEGEASEGMWEGRGLAGLVYLSSETGHVQRRRQRAEPQLETWQVGEHTKGHFADSLLMAPPSGCQGPQQARPPSEMQVLMLKCPTTHTPA